MTFSFLRKSILRRYFFYWRCGPTRTKASSFLRFLDHTQRRITVGRTPLDEWSARRRDLYLKTRNTHNRQTSMPPVGFELTISAGERPQTYALDRAATGTGILRRLTDKIFVSMDLSFSICLPAYRIDFTILILYGELFEKCMLLTVCFRTCFSFSFLKTPGLQPINLKFFFCLVVEIGLSRYGKSIWT